MSNSNKKDVADDRIEWLDQPLEDWVRVCVRKGGGGCGERICVAAYSWPIQWIPVAPGMHGKPSSVSDMKWLIVRFMGISPSGVFEMLG